jgi:MFS family permease
MSALIERPLQSEGSEFAEGWRVVLGANLGIAIGAAITPMLAISVFMGALEHEFGWNRTEISFGSTIVLAGLAVSAPLIGWLVDRVRAAWICAVGLIGLSAAYFGLSQLGADLRIFYISCAATALAACGAGTTTFARAVSESFVRQRGLALGIAMVGTGVTAFLMPTLLSPYAAKVGWRAGYRLMSLIVACGVPVVTLLLASAPRSQPRPPSPVDAGPLWQTRTGRVFWTLAVCFFVIPLSLGGMLVHLLSFLHDAGVVATTAGLIAGSAGAMQMVFRVLSGWLVDRVFAPRVAAVMMTTAAVALALVALLGASVALLAPFAFGLALGAEIDLLGYLTARYFGMRAYGRIYGLLYAATMIGTALSPVLYGGTYDATGSYRPALYAGAASLVISAILFMTLPSFPEEPA